MPFAHLLRLAALLCLAFVPPAQGGQGGNETWEAPWLVFDGEGEGPSAPNTWLCFRSEVRFDEVPPEAIARIAVDSRYWLWVNGELAVYEGGLKRGPRPGASYYDRVDMAPFLRPGKNTLALLLWHWGKSGFSHVSSGRAGLCFEWQVQGPAAPRTSPWRILPHPAYGDPEPIGPIPNYRLSEPNLRFDARRDPGAWMAPDFDDGAWPLAHAWDAPPAGPWGPLEARPIPLIRDLGVRAYTRVESESLQDGGRLLRAHLPKNSTVHPRLRIQAPAGLSIDIRTDNFRGGGEKNLRYQYITREGEQSFEGLSYLNGHAVHYTLPAGVKVLGLDYRETRYDTQLAGFFECDDPFYPRLWRKAADTLFLNMRDAIQDPDRERAQWWGDAVIALGQMFNACDARSHALARKAVLNLVDWQRPDGVLYSPIPAGKWRKELPLQMLASVGHYGFARYALYSGDLDTMRAVLPRVEQYLDLWQLDEQGLVIRRPGDWTWIDWGEGKDEPVLYDAWYHLALLGQAEMLQWSGEAPRAMAIRRKLAQHAEAFRAAYLRPNGFRSAAFGPGFDDRANALAVLAGLARPAEYPALRELLTRERRASPYMEKYVLEALFHMDSPDLALARMRERLDRQVASEITTLWELWELDPNRSSYNHAWSGGPLTLMHEEVAGIAPLTPGYARIRVRPRLGPLNRVRCRVPAVCGGVELDLSRSARAMRIALETPSPTHLIPPPPAQGEWRRMSLDGQAVWRRDRGLLPAGEGRVRLDGAGEPVLELPPGRWRLELSK